MKGQTKPDEFVWIFLAGVLAIIALIFAWGVPSPAENTTENITDLRGVFVIGTEIEEVPRIIRIGDFTTSYTVGSETISTSKYVEVRRGIFEDKPFSMSGRINSVDIVTDGWIVIDILQSNSAGNLIVKVNNKQVYNQKTNPGRINIPVEKELLSNYNVIEINAGFPGLQFWSTTVYRIEKIEFGINIYGNVKKTYEFELFSSELKSFEEGEIFFNVEERKGSGNLIIKINGKNVFNGIPSGTFSKSFEAFDVGLFSGINTIEFMTEKDTSYKLDDVELIIKHKEKGEKSRSFAFTISDSDMQKLRRGVKGKISFLILDSDLIGSLLIKITDAGGTEHQLDIVQSYAVGKKITVNFDQNDVDVGKNIVTFSVVGEGKFTLSNLEIVV